MYQYYACTSTVYVPALYPQISLRIFVVHEDHANFIAGSYIGAVSAGFHVFFQSALAYRTE